MKNEEIAKLLRNVAAAMVIKGENRFRIMAYEKAADSIEHLTSEVKDIWDEGKLNSITAVGSALAQHLHELFTTGKVTHFDKVFKGLPKAMFEFLQIPGLGPKRAYQLCQSVKITETDGAIDKLEKAVKAGKVAKIEGWGEKSQQELLANIQSFRQGQIKENRMPLPYADALASEMIAYLSKLPQVKKIDALGSLRRKVATIGDIDLAVAVNKQPDAKDVIKAFVSHPKVRKVVDQGDKGATILLGVGRQVDLRVQKLSAYGAMLQYFTGSKHHNIKLREYALKKGLSLSEYGIKKSEKTKSLPLTKGIYNPKLKIYEFASEKNFYQTLGLDWIPPEIREDAGEIETALRQAQGKHPGLPKLVNLKDIKGDVHMHSDYNLQPSHDLGTSSLETLLEQAATLNYEYIGISDHNPSISNHSSQQIIDILKKRHTVFEHLYCSWKDRENKRVHLLIMLEVDIDVKGNIALPEGADKYLDAFIVSIHSSFNLSKQTMTERIIKGLAHPKAKILGHPTGRILGKREGYEADWEKIFGFCAKNHKALEINAFVDRLDLPDLLVRQAINAGVKLIIGTDSHQVESLNLMKYGVDVARRGWARSADIINTYNYPKFCAWLKS